MGRIGISLDEWQGRGSREFRHRGHPVFTVDGGSTDYPPLLLIHGFPTASWDWEAVWDDLAADHRLIAADMIGFGFSAKPVDYPYAIADQADLFEALLEEHGIAEYHCLAHDYGDTVAQELLARQAEPGTRPRMLSLALLNGGLFPETHRPLLTQRLLASPVGPLVGRQLSRGGLERSMRRIFGPDTPPSPETVDGFFQLIDANGGRRVLHRLIGYMEERRANRERWVGALQRAAVPLTLIAGMADPISGAHMVARFRELVPGAPVTELDRIGHYPQVEAPAVVLAAYRAFRERVG